MKIVTWFLVGSRVLALSCGLTFLVAGCGGDNQTTGGVTAEDEMKKMQDTKKAMEEASKASKQK